MNTLCLDFGNTLRKAAIFENGELKVPIRLDGTGVDPIRRLIEKYKPVRSILSSVIDHEIDIETFLHQQTRFVKLSSKCNLPFTSGVGKPETIGGDRLALCAAAVKIFPSANRLIIGIGSCITFNFINKYNVFLGGSISPGLGLRFKSLHDFTAHLPLVTEDWNYPLIGFDTRTNIINGVILGMRLEIDGVIDEYARKFNNFNVLLTGGDGGYFARHLKNKIFADPHLIFKGLYTICEYNDDTKI